MGRFLETAKGLFERYARPADDMNQVPIKVLYHGAYDTSIVRDGESRAVNMWLDFMRESLSGDIVFFQAGLVRQDMYQDFGSKGIELTQLFMMEEFPWGDVDTDARSSLFPFEVTVEDLMLKTVPFLAKKYWCTAPFNAANRVHMSGLIVEMVSGDGCEDLAMSDLIRSVTFVGNCHQAGGLRSVDPSCCHSVACGRLWSGSDWDKRVTEEIRQEKLVVLTSQHCVPSKYGSHGPGFHEAGMLCADAEQEKNWGSGREIATRDGSRVMDIDATDFTVPDPKPSSWTPSFKKHGYFFKQSILSMLMHSITSQSVSSEVQSDCQEAQKWYKSNLFMGACECEMQIRSRDECGQKPGGNGFPRFHAAPKAAFNDQLNKCPSSVPPGLVIAQVVAGLAV